MNFDLTSQIQIQTSLQLVLKAQTQLTIDGHLEVNNVYTPEIEGFEWHSKTHSFILADK
jgi:hypothetical protein